ncbi:MAG: trimethylamine methyltransferase family protein, partial [Eubacterium sp.]
MDILFDRFRTLSLDDAAKIHEYTVDVLTQAGIWVEDDKARDIFKKQGAKVEGEKVYITEKMIDFALENAPETFEIKAMDPKNTKVFGGEDCIFAPAGGAVTICERDGIRRDPTIKDVNDFSKLVHCLDAIGLNRPAVHPADVDPLKKFLHITLSDYKYNDKIYQLRQGTLDMLCMIYGITREKMKEDGEKGIHYGYTTTNPVSPLELSTAATDTILFLAEYGIPNIIAPMPIGGISAPATVEATILMQN